MVPDDAKESNRKSMETYDLAWRQTIVQTEHAERRDVVKSKQYDDVCLRPQAQTSIYNSHNELCFTAPLGGVVGGIVTFQTASAPLNVPNRTSRTLLSQQEALPLGKIIWGSDRVTGPSPNSGRCISGAIVPKTKLQIVDCIPGNVNQTWTIVQEISKTPSF
ncbi:hypothetical protein C8J57DRAFT_1246987 [Mycena rebaudengoi]|nr:hypothetical protein C8J57DRAFT_1246987 [Mycena rebaudengoi]